MSILSQQVRFSVQCQHKLKLNHSLWLSSEMREMGIPILESPIADLEEMVADELLKNPELETDNEITNDAVAETSEGVEGEDDTFEGLWDSWQMVPSQRKNRDVWATAEASFYEESLAAQESLCRYLSRKLQQSFLTVNEQRIGIAIIEALDDAGFLTDSVATIAEVLHVASSQVEQVLSVIREIAPAGVGAKNLQEAYLLQLQRSEKGNSLAALIVGDYWTELTAGKISTISKSCGKSQSAVSVAIGEIAALSMRPAGDFSPSVDAIIPDAFVGQNADGSWFVEVNRGRTQLLRTSTAQYDKSVDRNVASFYNNLRRSASRFIGMIEFRHQTLLRVVSAVVSQQSDFLEKGDAFLIPLTQAEIAQEVELSEATISRLVNSKYIQTPHGTVPLQYFFDSGVSTFDAGQLSARAVKARIREIISSEDRKKPFSDQNLTCQLIAQGVDISCRGVNKYRQDMLIGSTRERRWA